MRERWEKGRKCFQKEKKEDERWRMEEAINISEGLRRIKINGSKWYDGEDRKLIKFRIISHSFFNKIKNN